MAQFLDKTGVTYLWSKIKAALDSTAPLASPTFTGTPTAPTVAVTDDSTKIATTEWVRDYLDSLDATGVSY